MDNKHKNETVLAIIDKGSLSEKITPPAKKSEIIEAMVQRRMSQIKAEISIALVEVAEASKVFQAAAKTAYMKYTAGKRVATLAECYSAGWYISGCGGVSHPVINVNSHINLPEVECAKLAPFAMKVRKAELKLRSLNEHRLTESKIRGEIRRAMSPNRDANGLNFRVNAILNDVESLKVIDAALDTIRVNGDPKTKTIDLG